MRDMQGIRGREGEGGSGKGARGVGVETLERGGGEGDLAGRACRKSRQEKWGWGVGRGIGSGEGIRELRGD